MSDNKKQVILISNLVDGSDVDQIPPLVDLFNNHPENIDKQIFREIDTGDENDIVLIYSGSISCIISHGQRVIDDLVKAFQETAWFYPNDMVMIVQGDESHPIVYNASIKHPDW